MKFTDSSAPPTQDLTRNIEQPYLWRMHQTQPFQSRLSDLGYHVRSHVFHLSIDFLAIYQKICTLKDFPSFLHTSCIGYLQHIEMYTCCKGLGEDIQMIVTYLSHVHGCPSCLVIDWDLVGRAFLCVSIDCDFSMLIHEDSPMLVDNIWKIDKGLSMTNRCTKFSRLYSLKNSN
jgi:hypothetical protein